MSLVKTDLLYDLKSYTTQAEFQQVKQVTNVNMNTLKYE